MMTLQAIAIWLVQALLFLVGIGTAGLAAHLGGPLIAGAFNVDDLIPSAIIFFAVAAALGWIGNKFWPEDWLYNPFL
ncbi:hypothetical protein [Afipia sp. GAS231]|uniref:hypothetical protein n=1 Tax=Afipia sp. GAS231 TaxID=1882747 RepID=UPI000879907D|nr:hypothetical protein [Afipia sp. GAS231]SDP47627.1 hypothetical protein SAMN05444050_6987 [Afipia sp. GAS231]